MLIDTKLDHQKAQEISRHRADVEEIKRQAQRWRLTDCSEETLNQMRHALIEEMEALEERLSDANDRFVDFVENGRPLEAEQALQAIDRLTNEWESMNRHLQEIDEAILERHLHHRLMQKLGGERWVQVLDAAVLVAIIVVVSLTVIELLFSLSVATTRTIILVDTIICFFLIADFFLRLTLSEDSTWYFRRHWVDLAASIPLYELLRFGRLAGLIRFARLIRFLRLRRAMRVLRNTFRGLDKLFQTFQLNLLKRSVLIALALLFFGALSIRALEGARGLPLHTLDESLWWSFATVVTGGFADLYNPATFAGRLVTVGLVLLGLTVTGIFTASLTSVLVEDDSSRIEQNQHVLEAELDHINHKLDLLSSETNEGLIALETVSQQLSNQMTREAVAAVLIETIIRDFQGIQTSVHLLNPEQTGLYRLHHQGASRATPPDWLPVGKGLMGRVIADLLEENNVAALDLEPETEPLIATTDVAMVCPLVAGKQVLGALHLVLPQGLGRYYLYNRVPMTLAHHAATAFRAADLADRLAHLREEW